MEWEHVEPSIASPSLDDVVCSWDRDDGQEMGWHV